jgi:hypothetical protein
MMLDSVWIEVYALDLRPGPAIVLGTDRIIQDNFSPALRRVGLDQEHGRWEFDQ